MDFDEKEVQVAQILLQFPRLVFDSEIRSMFSLGWGSKKQRKVRRFAPLSGRRIPISFPNSKLRKRKQSENHHRNAPRFGGTKGRSCSCVCAVEGGSSKGKKAVRSSKSSGSFLLPDLNLPQLIEEEPHWHKQEAPTPTLLLSAC